MIATPGGRRAIETLAEGDLVIARDQFGRLREQSVTRTYRALANSYLRINGSLEVTVDHPFMVGSRWANAGGLTVGDRLTLLGGGSRDVLSVEVVNRGVRVYNIEVGTDHTFFANGILVHNKGHDWQG